VELATVSAVRELGRWPPCRPVSPMRLLGLARLAGTAHGVFPDPSFNRPRPTAARAAHMQFLADRAAGLRHFRRSTASAPSDACPQGASAPKPCIGPGVRSTVDHVHGVSDAPDQRVRTRSPQACRWCNGVDSPSAHSPTAATPMRMGPSAVKRDPLVRWCIARLQVLHRRSAFVDSVMPFWTANARVMLGENPARCRTTGCPRAPIPPPPGRALPRAQQGALLAIVRSPASLWRGAAQNHRSCEAVPRAPSAIAEMLISESRRPAAALSGASPPNGSARARSPCSCPSFILKDALRHLCLWAASMSIWASQCTVCQGRAAEPNSRSRRRHAFEHSPRTGPRQPKRAHALRPRPGRAARSVPPRAEARKRRRRARCHPIALALTDGPDAISAARARGRVCATQRH